MTITKCASCGVIVPAGRTDCPRCGGTLGGSVGGHTPVRQAAGLIPTCTSCGAPLAPGMPFCVQCGTRSNIEPEAPGHPEPRVQLPTTAGGLQRNVAGGGFSGVPPISPPASSPRRGGVSDLPVEGLAPPPKRTRRLGVLVGVLLTISALTAAVGAAAIGLRVSITSDAPVRPLLGSHNKAAIDAVADSTVWEIEDAAASELSHSELITATTAVVVRGVADGKWRASINEAHRDTLEVSRDGYGESTMDISWVFDELIRRGDVEASAANLKPLIVISPDNAPSLKRVRDRLGSAAFFLPIIALVTGGLGFIITRKDRFRSLRAFSVAAACTSVVLGALIATVPHLVVRSRAETDATRDLASQVVGALVRPTLVAVAGIFLLEVVLFIVAHVVLRRRLRQAKLPASTAT